MKTIEILQVLTVIIVLLLSWIVTGAYKLIQEMNKLYYKVDRNLREFSEYQTKINKMLLGDIRAKQDERM